MAYQEKEGQQQETGVQDGHGQFRTLIVEHAALALGAMIAVLLLGLIKDWEPFVIEQRNLYVVYAPCEEPAANLAIFNSYGEPRFSDDNGVIINAPAHWTEVGSKLHVRVGDQLLVISVREVGRLEIDGFCAGTELAFDMSHG